MGELVGRSAAAAAVTAAALALLVGCASGGSDGVAGPVVPIDLPAPTGTEVALDDALALVAQGQVQSASFVAGAGRLDGESSQGQFHVTLPTTAAVDRLFLALVDGGVPLRVRQPIDYETVAPDMRIDHFVALARQGRLTRARVDRARARIEVVTVDRGPASLGYLPDTVMLDHLLGVLERAAVPVEAG